VTRRNVAFVAPALVALLPVVALGLAEPKLMRSSTEARSSRCNHVEDSPLAYHYPIKPFLRQHPIRGNFGDPRTLTDESFGSDTPRSPGSFTFHNGIDISAATGTPVYPVVSGYARIGYADEVIVVTEDDRVFQYFHIRPRIEPGQAVTAGRTLLGRVLPGWQHVHLTEIDGFKVHNPVDPGHLEPYADHTVPAVEDLEFTDAEGRDVDPERLSGLVNIAANARDTPPVAVPGEWFGFPVTPALVRWKLTEVGGKIVVPPTSVVDFSRTEPSNRDFWSVYAAGTYQNFPVFAHHYFFHHSGRYLFNLTPTPLDTRRFPDGAYVVTVVAGDVCGNRGSASQLVRIRNG
jgi:hypothetical protein